MEKKISGIVVRDREGGREGWGKRVQGEEKNGSFYTDMRSERQSVPRQ